MYLCVVCTVIIVIQKCAILTTIELAGEKNAHENISFELNMIVNKGLKIKLFTFFFGDY